mgnify:CR=1 FL=1
MGNFTKILEAIHSRHVYIQTHNFPDPDAISCGYALSELLGNYGIKADICYHGEIDRYSTNDFVFKLGIELTDIDKISITPEDEIILVDSQRGNSNISDVAGNSIVCIDHHPSFEDNAGISYRYADIRPELGACATIITEYYREEKVHMSAKVATALLYGIKTDTAGFSRGVDKQDVEAYHYLFGKADLALIRSFEHCSLKFDDLKAYANAINSIKVCDNLAFANTGRDCPETLIATISDFMTDLIEVDFVVVYSIKSDGIKLSVRSSGKLDAGYITNRALAGMGSGGGHASMAGGFVPITGSLEELDECVDTIEKNFIREIKG